MLKGGLVKLTDALASILTNRLEHDHSIGLVVTAHRRDRLLDAGGIRSTDRGQVGGVLLRVDSSEKAGGSRGSSSQLCEDREPGKEKGGLDGNHSDGVNEDYLEEEEELVLEEGRRLASLEE